MELNYTHVNTSVGNYLLYAKDKDILFCENIKVEKDSEKSKNNLTYLINLIEEDFKRLNFKKLRIKVKRSDKNIKNYLNRQGYKKVKRGIFNIYMEVDKKMFFNK